MVPRVREKIANRPDSLSAMAPNRTFGRALADGYQADKPAFSCSIMKVRFIFISTVELRSPKNRNLRR